MNRHGTYRTIEQLADPVSLLLLELIHPLKTLELQTYSVTIEECVTADLSHV